MYPSKSYTAHHLLPSMLIFPSGCHPLTCPSRQGSPYYVSSYYFFPPHWQPSPTPCINTRRRPPLPGSCGERIAVVHAAPPYPPSPPPPIIIRRPPPVLTSAWRSLFPTSRIPLANVAPLSRHPSAHRISAALPTRWPSTPRPSAVVRAPLPQSCQHHCCRLQNCKILLKPRLL